MRTPAQRARNTEIKRRSRIENRDGYNAYMRAYRASNKEKWAAISKASYDRNREGNIAAAKAYRVANTETINAKAKAYRMDNRDRLNARERELRRLSPEKYRSADRMRRKSPENRIRYAARDAVRRMAEGGAPKKNQSAVKYLGAPVHVVREHIESLWEPGMSWENYGFYGWHIDHIRPLNSFDVTNPGATGGGGSLPKPPAPLVG